MSGFYEAKVNQIVHSAQDLDELIPILRLIPLDKVQTFITQNLDKSLTHFTPINKILPQDLIRYILSFEALYTQAKCVCKQWNTLCNQNDKQYYLALQRSLDQTSVIPYNNRNHTWIVHPKATQLSQVEIDLGFAGLINDLQDAFVALAVSGDRLFLHEAIHYVVDQKRSPLNVDISIVGLGNNAVIASSDSNLGTIGGRFWQGYIENIIFQLGDGKLDIARNSKLWLNRCKLKLATQKPPVTYI